MKKIIISAFLVALGPGMLLTGCKSGGHESSQEKIKVDVARPVVDSIVVTEIYPGELKADKALEVVARVNGYLVKKCFEDGDFVREGQVLYLIEDTNYRNAVQEAEATLATAKATADYATRQYAAMKKAYESQAVSQMDVVKAESAMNEANASIKSAEASLETARTSLGYCTVRAKASGHVASPDVTVGQYVAGAASPVFLTTIYDDTTVKVDFALDETKYQEILNNKTRTPIDFSHIKVTFNNTLPHSYSGRLDYVAPDVNVSTGTIKLNVLLDNPYNELKEGMYALVHMPVAELPHAVLIKDAAISSGQAGKYVYVVNDSDQVEVRNIQVGSLYNDTLRVVESGLSPSDRYVTRALLKVKEGMSVDPVLK